jgi:SPP1 gp7 family putative phage head morphogenesis protein
VEGETIADISRRIVGSAGLKGADGVTEITRQGAESITRTAVNHFADAAKAALYEENRDIISEEVYHATLDSRTTPRCAGLDGKRFKVGVGPRPPQHFRCRSVRIPVVAGDLIGDRPMTRSTERELLGEFADERGIDRVSSRDDLPRGTKGAFDEFARRRVRAMTGLAPATTTYGDFLSRQSVAFQEEVLGKTKARLFRDGGLRLDRFNNRRGDELTLAQLARSEADVFRRAGLDPRDFLP